MGENERGGFRRTRARSPVLSRDAVVQGRSPDILVKPTDPALRTNLVINATKRTYHVELRSTPATYMASVG